MRTHEVAGKVSGSGEYVLGHDATGSHACYLIYGVLKPGETDREFRPGRGHEEMVLVISGQLRLRGHETGTLEQGKAIHLRDEERCLADNPGAVPAVYVIAGGHSGSEHHG